ncbi:MAG: VanZ family protein, partial [Desulforhabdus sp.]|nr:VanZ family protein [Desulforhabdus sp.]
HALAMSIWADGGEPSRHNWIPSLLYAAFIASMSHRSLEGVHVPINVNFFHPLEYAVLAIFFCWSGSAVLISGKISRLFFMVVACGFAFAVLDELHQFFIPGRAATLVDLVLDLIGLCLGCCIFFIGRQLRNSVVRDRPAIAAR